VSRAERGPFGVAPRGSEPGGAPAVGHGGSGVTPSRMKVVEGDITRLRVDAIVNAANSSLLGGGGVDGAIHRAAGPGLLEECRLLGGCATGDAKVTGGHLLDARWVIHTVGPVWRGGDAGEPAALTSCYLRILEEAERIGAAIVAVPGISTGLYGYPIAEAAQIAVDAVRAWLACHDTPREVIFCTFDAESTTEIEARLTR
jgi:O-acetyl-ADP-ribose deacetylase (regulator of RNase III)